MGYLLSASRVGYPPTFFLKGIAMSTTNYVCRLALTLAKDLREKIARGDAWEISDFRELIAESRKVYTDNRDIRKVCYTVLTLIPRLDAEGRQKAWSDIRDYFNLKKVYAQSSKKLDTMSDADIDAHFERMFG